MGTFMHELGQLTIPDARWPAFLEDAIRVLNQGGMFARGYCSFMGKNIWLLRTPSVEEDEKVVDTSFNYFEDSFWENAGISLKRHDVYSGKIGWSRFNRAVQALYCLAELYSDTPYASANDSRRDQVEAIQWLRYVLKRELHYKWRKNLWQLCEQEAKQESESDPIISPSFISDYMADEADSLEMMATVSVLMGLDEFINPEARIEDKESKTEGIITFLHAMIVFYDEVKAYKDSSDLPEDEQIQFFIRFLKKLHATEPEDKELMNQHSRIAISSLVLPPQSSVKVIAEIYGRNFWELWWRIKDEFKDTEIIPLIQEETKILVPYSEMSTEEFFGVTAWDRLFWWQKDGDVELTDEIKTWLRKKAARHNELWHQPIPGDVAGWQRRFITLLTEHPKVCCFEGLFFEFMGNFHENMVRAAVILLEETATDTDDYRRLMAVMANKELRYGVFLF